MRGADRLNNTALNTIDFMVDSPDCGCVKQKVSTDPRLTVVGEQ